MHCLLNLALCENGMVLRSTLNATIREYACVDETVVITCSGGTGIELKWHYNDLQFVFDDNSVNLPQAMYNGPERVIAYMTNRTSLDNGTFRYISQLSIERITVASVDVNCTVTLNPINMTDSVVHGLSVRMTGMSRPKV